jgi:hypothetical protein
MPDIEKGIRVLVCGGRDFHDQEYMAPSHWTISHWTILECEPELSRSSTAHPLALMP